MEYTKSNVFYYCKKINRIAVLEKLEDTKTNEDRKYIIDQWHATYRANKLKLVCIVDPAMSTFSKTNSEMFVDTKTENIEISHRY